MRPMYGWPEKVQDSLTTHMATVPKVCNGLLFTYTLSMYLPNLKAVALPVPEIVGGTPKNWGVPGYAHGPFLEIF